MQSMESFRQELALIKNQINQKNFKPAFIELCRIATVDADFAVQHRFAKLFASIPSEALELKPIRIGIVPTGTLDNFIGILRFYLARAGLIAEIFVAEFNTLHQTILTPDGPLYTFNPQIIWLCTNYRDISCEILPNTNEEEIARAIQSEVDRFIDLWLALQANCTAIIVQNNADLPSERIFGNFEASIPWSRQNFLRQFNLALAHTSLAHHVHLLDLEYLSAQFGKRFWHDAPYWHYSKHAFVADASGLIALQMAALVQASQGMAKKCLVLDLDNTLWGGIIGDDGLEGIQLGHGLAAGEAFMAFQHYLKQLQRRGVILTVCSKNEESNAKIPFLEHSEMVLKLEDIAVFVANWHNKADNIREIADMLEIGLESMVFVDDNPAERQLVRQMLPMVSVVEMPTDPALYVIALDQSGYFETLAFSTEDQNRGQMYQQNAQRKQTRKHFSNVSDFLQDLHMVAKYGDLHGQNRARASQLILKSNQFHLTTTRYSEAQLERMMTNEAYICRYYCLQDRFGDNGLVSVVLLKQEADVLLVDTWVMSCRVLSRGMEEFIHNDMITQARARGCNSLFGTYIATKKNNLVAQLFARLDYQLIEETEGTSRWRLSIEASTPLKSVLIQAKEE